MKLRTIDNKGDDVTPAAPVVDSQGALCAQAKLSFQLVDRCGRVVKNALDAISYETLVAATATVVTDELGLFTVDLWPTGRGANSYYYRVKGETVDGRPIVDFTAALADGETVLDWIEFMASAGLWSEARPVTLPAADVVLVDLASKRAFALGVAIDPDTQGPTTTYKEL